jgi:hypothetical protein
MASAFGSAVGGFMAGQKHSDQRRRDKAIDSLLARDAYEKDQKYASQAIDWENEGNDPDFFPKFEDPTEEDPYLVRGFNWLKNKFGFAAGEQAPDQVVTPPTDEEVEPKSAVPAGRFMADGGRVHGDEVTDLTPEDVTLLPNENSGVNYVGDVFDDTRQVWQGADDAMQGRVQAIKDAEGAAETGGAIRDWAWEGTKGTLATGAALAKDVVVDNPLVQGVLGFVGFDGKSNNRQPDPKTPPPAAPAADTPVVGESPKTAAIDAAVGDEKPADQVAADAVQKGVEMTPGHPDNPDQAFDWAEVAETGVRPEDIPNMTVKDWVQYRQKAVSAAILRGETPQQAHEAVTKMQMQGAQSNLMQAGFLLQAGNPRGAALAARAAFQYFPNGADVQFGIYETPDGPVLVGMGKDEETGEPIKDGAPMMLTNEKLQAMAANFADPTAFNTWTKDWRDEEFKRRKYNEVEKPQAQSEAIYRDRMGRAALQNADSNALEAQARGRGTGSVKESDFRESFQIQAEGLYMGGIEEEDLIDMNVIANRIRQAVPNQQALSDDQIVKMVLGYYESGDPSEIQRYVGGGDAAE